MSILTKGTRNILLILIREYATGMKCLVESGASITQLEVTPEGNISIFTPATGFWNSLFSKGTTKDIYFFDICNDLIPLVAKNDEGKTKALMGLRSKAFATGEREDFVKMLYGVHLDLPQLPKDNGGKDGKGGDNQQKQKGSDQNQNQKGDKNQDGKDKSNQNVQKDAPERKNKQPEDYKYGEKVPSYRGENSLETARINNQVIGVSQPDYDAIQAIILPFPRRGQ